MGSESRVDIISTISISKYKDYITLNTEYWEFPELDFIQVTRNFFMISGLILPSPKQNDTSKWKADFYDEMELFRINIAELSKELDFGIKGWWGRGMANHIFPVESDIGDSRYSSLSKPGSSGTVYTGSADSNKYITILFQGTYHQYHVKDWYRFLMYLFLSETV